MSNLRFVTSTVTILIAFGLFQLHHIVRHEQYKKEERIPADPYLFTRHFALLPLSRTLKHEKGIDYWFDWLQHEAGFRSIHKVISLLHFDLHGIEDNSEDLPSHICSPANLFTYDFFVQHTLESAYIAYFEEMENDLNQTVNVTRHALRIGYIKDVVWIYPDHWLTHQDESLSALRKLIYHQTYFLNPTKQKVFYLHNTVIDEHHELWNKLFATKKELFVPLGDDDDDAPNVSSLDHLEINIWVLSLSQYLSEPHFVGTSAQPRHLILDFDLDFFLCQEPAQTFLNHFDWTRNIADRFNHILQHHQYIPSHMFSEYSNEAIATLLFLLNENKTDELQKLRQDPRDKQKPHFLVPRIEDVFNIALQEQMEIETIERAMYLLYEYQLERMQDDPQCAQHLMHFDQIFQILHRAHRRLSGEDGQVIAYKNADDAPRLRRKKYSRHWQHLRDIAVRKEKLEHFRLEKRETEEIKRLDQNSEDTFRTFDEFADKLVGQRQHERRRLQSAEIDVLGEQKQMNKEKSEQILKSDRVYQNEWSDQQLKELMNMTSDYLYHDWKQVLFDENNGDNSWKSKYPQWTVQKVKKQIHDDEDDENEDGDSETQDNMLKIVHSEHAPYHQDNDHMKMYRAKSESETNSQDAFKLKLNNLDPLQIHFLNRANHSELESFVNNLNRKQHSFLKWLVFCYYHKVSCIGKQHFPQGFNDSFHFGYDFQWHEINGWPQLIEQPDKSEALQLQIERTRSPHSEFTPFSVDESDGENNIENVLLALPKIEQILREESSMPLIVGIELSPGHVSKKERYRIECDLYKLIKHVMWRKNPAIPCFVRLSKLQDDAIVPYRPCAFL